jgi:acyl-CoA synthetase (NDP forming)/RimJ/RimL family protein N-acetyltransferase
MSDGGAADAYTSDVVLKDGRTIHLRPIRPDDLDAMLAMWQRLSPETIRMRFFAPRKMTVEQMRHLVEVDGVWRFALVAVQHGDIVAVGRFDRLPDDPGTAEFAVTVQDDQHGRGLGTTLLRALMAPARDLGVARFHGDILTENRSMLKVMRESGFEPAIRSYGDTVTATFTTTPTESLLQRAGEQDRRAARAALSSVLRPASVAVVGASRDRDTVGGQVLANLIAGGYEGPVYPVNPNAAHVQSVVAYPSVAACPTVPETIYVCVPPDTTRAVVDEAGRLGVAAAVIIGAGFSESGTEGLQIEREVLESARTHGMRLIGPNCMGVMNTAGDVRLNGSLSAVVPGPGRVALSSQSGALGRTILAVADQLGVGLSSFASIGNKADISSNDLLQYWEQDPDTGVILLYLESFGNPRKFARIARRVGRDKPIVAVKAGGGDAGTVQALFDQAGVVRVETLDQMFNVARLLATQPLPGGHRVAVLSNGGGPGVLAADSCRAAGLQLAELSADARIAAREAGAGAEVPVTVHPTTPAATYGAVLSAIVADPGVDAVVAIFIPPVTVDAEALGSAIADATRGCGKPITAVFMSMAPPPAALSAAGIPVYVFPESAAEALGLAARYAAWTRRDLGNVVAFDDTDGVLARRVVDRVLAGGPAQVTLAADDAGALLTAFGISTAAGRVVADPAGAAAAAAALGPPVVVKPAAAIEKADRGLVRLGLATPDAAAEAVGAMTAALLADGDAEVAGQGWLVQQMVPDGVEMVVEVRQDPTFGPVIATGFGGALVELLGDTATRISPLTDVDVDDMLLELRGYPLLTGYRGATPADVDALRALLLRVAAMVEAVPEIQSVDLNPVFVRTRGVAVVDSRIRIASGRRPRDPLSG